MTNHQSVFIPDTYQQQVINAHLGYHLVLASPGCGKTQILTERIKLAHKHGIRYENMLCLTFTNRAARGMSERIGMQIFNEEVSSLYVGNIHRFCFKFLLDNELIPSESSVIDEEDAISIIARSQNNDELAVISNYQRRKECALIIQFAGLMHQIAHHHSPKLRIHPECFSSDDVIALRKLCELLDKTIDANTTTYIYRNTEKVRDCIHLDTCDLATYKLIDVLLRKMQWANHYDRYKKENKLLDFEDLLLQTYDAFANDSNGVFCRYEWIQVDEVQDLNALQLAIVDQLTAKQHFTVMYLGDEQQAIFSFMGAKIDTIDMLKDRCKNNIHFLFVNHRSPKYLLDVYNCFAEKQLNIDAKLLPSTQFNPQREGNELLISASLDVETMVDDVAVMVKSLYKHNPTQTIAVIVNANADAEMLSNGLERQEISYFKVSGEDLFSSPLVKVLMAHLNVLANEHNFIAWSRILKGLKVFESNADARAFVRGLMDRAMLPSDMLCFENDTYLQRFVRVYEEHELVIFDTETTGLNIFEDDIVQIAAVKMRQGKLVEGSQFMIMMQTNREIPAKLGETDNPLIAEMKHHTLVSPAEGLQKFIDYIGNGVLLAHNADYDYHILDYNLQRYLPSIVLKDRCGFYLDSLKLARLLEPNMVQYKLKYLLEALQLEGSNTHLADEDVNATTYLVRHCYGKAKLLIPSQYEWLSHSRFKKRIDVLRRNYQEIYQDGKERLYKLQTDTTKSALVEEIQKFYQALCEAELFKPIASLQYIIHYLQEDLIGKLEKSLLINELYSYMPEINTLKEADLCSSKTLHERVFVTTIHKAKGLEFDNVIVFDAVDGRFPNYLSKHNSKQLQEDMRKFYVAITRAKSRLWVTYSTTRLDYHNNRQPRYLTPFMQPLLHFFEISK